MTGFNHSNPTIAMTKLLLATIFTVGAFVSFAQSEYCFSTSVESGPVISNVLFNNLFNYTGDACGDYSDFTDMPAFLYPGGDIELNISTSSCGNFSNIALKAFIDWNGDYDFDDVSETVVSLAGVAGNFYSVPVSVPLDVQVGITTRMRVIIQQTSNAEEVSACGEYLGGETEDYRIDIVEDAFVVSRHIEPTQLPEFSASVNEASEASSFFVSTFNVASPVYIIANPPFEISSLAFGDYSNQLEFTPDSYTRLGVRVHVRYTPTSGTNHQDVIAIVQDGQPTAYVSVSGLVVQGEAVTITGFDPMSGPVNTLVNITGTGFTEEASVYFHGVPSSEFFVNSSTSISAVVPAGATTGPIDVVTTAGYATSVSIFSVTIGENTPIISQLTPSIGIAGDNVIINGEGFVDITSVQFNGTPCTNFTVNSPNEISAVVPVGASTGKVTVSSSSVTATSLQDFVISSNSTVTAPELYLHTNVLQPDGFIKDNNLSPTDALYIGDYLYVTYSGTSEAALAIFDASDFLNPEFVTSIDYTDREFSKMLFDGDRLYIIGKGLSVYDLSNPTDPLSLAFHMNTVDASNSFLHSNEIDKYGHLLFMDHGYAGMKVVDISNLNAPVRTGLRNMSGSGYAGMSVPNSSSIIAFDDYDAYFASLNPTTGALANDGSLSVAGWPVDVITKHSGIVFVSAEGNSAGYVSAVDPIGKSVLDMLDISEIMTYPGRVTIANNNVLLVKAQMGNSFLAIDISDPHSIQLMKKYQGNSSNGGGCFRFFDDRHVLLMNAGKVLGIYSNVPPIAAPTATEATSITTTSFTANWTSVPDAVSYELDVSTDDFSTFLFGYNGRSVTETTRQVTGLNNNTTYKYRVRAVKSPGIESPNSNVVSVTPLSSNPPSITSFSPSLGAAGEQITIRGNYFSGTTSVSLNGLAMDFTVISPTEISVVVPEGATSGLIAVTTPSGTDESSSVFTVTSLTPIVESLSPASGEIGTSVNISGSNFDLAPSNNTVKFNNVVAVVTSATATMLIATVPVGASTGKISVTVNGVTGTSQNDFTVVVDPDAPLITGFSPTSGAVGTSVTIQGQNLLGATSLKLGTKTLSFTVGSSTSITTVIPEGSATGKFSVSTPDGAAQSTSNFVVTSENTRSGTYLIKDIAPGQTSSGPLRLRTAGGLVYFYVRPYDSPIALYRSDGTEEGTYMIKEDFELEPVDYAFRNSTEHNGNIIFSHEGQVWMSDGTEEGTRSITNFDLELSHSTYNYTSFNGALYFILRADVRKCYKWDGTSLQLVYQSTSTFPLDIVPAGDKLFLFEELAIYDITNGTAVKVFDQIEENERTNLSRLLGGPFVYFNGMIVYNDKTPGGTESTIRGIKYFNPSTNTAHRIVDEGRLTYPSSSYSTYAIVNSNLVFASVQSVGSPDPEYHYKLLKINSDFQLSTLKEIVFPDYEIPRVIVSNGSLAAAVVETHTLLLTDGTTAGTEVVVDEEDNMRLNIEQEKIYISASKLFFAASTESSGYELYSLDLNGDRIPVSVEFGQGQFGNCCSELVSIREDQVITAAARNVKDGNFSKTVHGNELWASDGSPITEEPCSLPKPELNFDGRFLSFLDYDGEYRWYRNGTLLTEEDDFAIEPTVPGLYTLVVVVDGCASPESEPYEVEGTITSAEVELKNRIEVSPNPSSGFVKISITNLEQANVKAVLHDQLGRIVEVIRLERIDQKHEATVDISRFASGLYYFNITTADGAAIVKLIKN